MLGSVNGKYEARTRVRVPSPNITDTKWSIAPRRWAIVSPLSMASASIWWKTGVCVASRSSVRNTLPGETT